MDEEILELAMAVSGAAEEERALLARLCPAARRRWEARLRQGVTAEDCGEALLCAAALTAAADFSACRGGSGQVESFTVGEVSVRTGGAGSSPSGELRETAEELMAPYTAMEGFCFRGVRG
ncbi:MAG: hypothetical protein HFG09_05120 [Oscillibacter sp.]|nr:hypothetical protein [Oscillibacter sp.]